MQILNLNINLSFNLSSLTTLNKWSATNNVPPANNTLFLQFIKKNKIL